ncbi:MAG TPA: DUF6454 family protein [Vicinamibacterales bacterium]|nr:DUF6454 family protein [Vicinamibacterales bacterium]
MRCALACAVAAAALSVEPRATVAERVMKLTRESAWRPTGSVRVQFRAWHPQGLVKIGDTFFLSSVEVRSRERGEGIGHLFKFDRAGALVTDLTLGEGAIYHPGGIDYDGTHIWVPVAEYRPDSRSIVYRVDPVSMKATEILRFADHIGAIVRNTDDNTLHGVSWDSRRLYRWTPGGERTPPLRTINPSHYLDYQDCKYAGGRRMLCTGVTEIKQGSGAAPFRLGGIELVDLVDGRPVFQVPLLLWTTAGLAMTQNPAWFEETRTGLRGYFMPEDDVSTLYIYEVETT